MKEYGVTGVRLPREQFEKLNRMAASLNVSRNKVVGMLVEAAEVQSKPAVSVNLKKENGRSVETLAGLHTASVVG